jgi:hypothetical protein
VFPRRIYLAAPQSPDEHLEALGEARCTSGHSRVALRVRDVPAALSRRWRSDRSIEERNLRTVENDKFRISGSSCATKLTPSCLFQERRGEGCPRKALKDASVTKTMKSCRRSLPDAGFGLAAHALSHQASNGRFAEFEQLTAITNIAQSSLKMLL